MTRAFQNLRDQGGNKVFGIRPDLTMSYAWTSSVENLFFDGDYNLDSAQGPYSITGVTAVPNGEYILITKSGIDAGYYVVNVATANAYKITDGEVALGYNSGSGMSAPSIFISQNKLWTKWTQTTLTEVYDVLRAYNIPSVGYATSANLVVTHNSKDIYGTAGNTSKFKLAETEATINYSLTRTVYSPSYGLPVSVESYPSSPNFGVHLITTVGTSLVAANKYWNALGTSIGSGNYVWFQDVIESPDKITRIDLTDNSVKQSASLTYVNPLNIWFMNISSNGSSVVVKADSANYYMFTAGVSTLTQNYLGSVSDFEFISVKDTSDLFAADYVSGGDLNVTYATEASTEYTGNINVLPVPSPGAPYTITAGAYIQAITKNSAANVRYLYKLSDGKTVFIVDNGIGSPADRYFIYKV